MPQLSQTQFGPEVGGYCCWLHTQEHPPLGCSLGSWGPFSFAPSSVAARCHFRAQPTNRLRFVAFAASGHSPGSDPDLMLAPARLWPRCPLPSTALLGAVYGTGTDGNLVTEYVSVAPPEVAGPSPNAGTRMQTALRRPSQPVPCPHPGDWHLQRHPTATHLPTYLPTYLRLPTCLPLPVRLGWWPKDGAFGTGRAPRDPQA